MLSPYEYRRNRPFGILLGLTDRQGGHLWAGGRRVDLRRPPDPTHPRPRVTFHVYYDRSQYQEGMMAVCQP